MFGYVVVQKPELKFKEFDEYKSYYCGLCRSLKSRHGIAGQLTLSYDMTFLVMLLTSLYDSEVSPGTCKCVAHPFSTQHTRISSYSEYVADMNVMLSYYKCIDDWQDEHKLSRLIFSNFLKQDFSKDATYNAKFIPYNEKADKIAHFLTILHENEQNGVTDIDTMAGLFGNIMAELFAPHHDVWENSLRKIGFFLGKFIYILDAYDDLEEDIKKGSYNPFKDIHNNADFDSQIFTILKMMMAECANEFELLPIIDNIEILRNILYAGVWQNKALHKERN